MIAQFTRRSAAGRTGTAVALASLLALGLLGLTDAVRGDPAVKPAAEPAAAAATQPSAHPAAANPVAPDAAVDAIVRKFADRLAAAKSPTTDAFSAAIEEMAVEIRKHDLLVDNHGQAVNRSQVEAHVREAVKQVVASLRDRGIAVPPALGGTIELSGGKIELRDTAAGTEIRADRVTFRPGAAGTPTTAPTAAGGNDAERTYAQFQRRLPEVKFDGIGLGDVIDFLRDVTGQNIVLNIRALEGAGVEKSAPVTLQLRDAALEQVLRQVLEQAGGGSAALGFGVEGNGIVITTAEAVPTRVRAYDVSELVSTATTRPGSEGVADATETLVNLVKDNVATDSWRDNGGTIGTISSFGGRLVINTTDMNHLQIDRLLAELRSSQPAAAKSAAAH
jgi:hypothetical protein